MMMMLMMMMMMMMMMMSRTCPMVCRNPWSTPRLCHDTSATWCCTTPSRNTTNFSVHCQHTYTQTHIDTHLHTHRQTDSVWRVLLTNYSVVLPAVRSRRLCLVDLVYYVHQDGRFRVRSVCVSFIRSVCHSATRITAKVISHVHLNYMPLNSTDGSTVQ